MEILDDSYITHCKPELSHRTAFSNSVLYIIIQGVWLVIMLQAKIWYILARVHFNTDYQKHRKLRKQVKANFASLDVYTTKINQYY